MQGTMVVLDGRPRDPIAFDTDEPETVARATERFEREVKEKNGNAFDAKTKERIETFDPNESPEVIITPQFQGG